jgi:hypothetical protein
MITTLDGGDWETCSVSEEMGCPGKALEGERKGNLVSCLLFYNGDGKQIIG